jgi:Tol biopolymer transport system component
MKKALLLTALTIICLAFGTAYVIAASVICADANGDNKVNLSDVSYTINYLYRSGPAPNPLKAADPDNSNKINLLDVSYTINYLYRSGPKPVCSKYLGQLPPDSIPQIFAPGLISTLDMEFTASFDPSFQEFYFTRRGTDNINKIYFSKIIDGHWNDPTIAPFCDEHFYMEPLFTPDGQKLFFSSDRPCSGCVIANWYVTRSGPTWSDPQTLGAPLNSVMMMYSTQSSNGNIYFTNISATPAGIYLSRFVDGLYQTPEKLGTAINKGYNEAHPYIAPDESYMIFDAQNRPGGVGGSDLYISYRNDDGSWTESVNLGSNFNTAGEDLAPTVTPDGKYFFYARPNGLKHDIYWCSTAFIEYLRPCTGTIAYTITPSDGNNQIHTMNCTGTDLQQLTSLPGRNMGPDWSSDGSKIAFYTHFDADNTWSIYVMDADGGNVTRLTNNSGDWDWSPQWSPDGTKLLFARMYPSDYHSDIWMINADGSDLHRVGPVIGFGPKWSSDGEKIIYSGLAGDYEIFSMDTSGANQVQLTDNSAEDYWPSWSPDGSKILFVSNRDGNFEVYTMNADGTNPIRLTTSTQNEEDAKWSPDGSQIAYVSWLVGHMEIYTMKADGSGQTRLTINTSDHAFDPDWKP